MNKNIFKTKGKKQNKSIDIKVSKEIKKKKNEHQLFILNVLSKNKYFL